MIRPPQRLKFVAAELARLFESTESTRVLKLMAQLLKPGFGDADLLQSLMEPLPDTKNGIARIGIWESREIDGERHFVRAQTSGSSWTSWANLGRILPKRNRRRVLFFGESVARGYFYDPHFNPASTLQAMLQAACGGESIEVIDLARVGLRFDQLWELVRACPVLDPDALVILAGNNWHPTMTFQSEEFDEVAAILRAGSDWATIKQSIENLLSQKVEALLHMLGQFGRTHRIPIIYVLPEFNLGDWRNDCASPPLIGSELTTEWVHLRRQGEESLGNREWEKAEGHGRRLLELDGGTTPVGPNILAKVRLASGAKSEAREFLELARDAGICWPTAGTPRCYSIIQRTIRSRVKANGIHLVDLPNGFERYLNGDLPDRRLFLDYCHFTVEGVNVAMALTAETLLPLLRKPEWDFAKLLRSDTSVNPKIVGEGQFLAAVHNAGWGQGDEIVRYHCQRAVECYPKVRQMMKLFLEMHIRRAPSSLCKAFD